MDDSLDDRSSADTTLSAADPTTMTRWQYQIVNLGTVDAARRLGMTLSYMGRNGWELVAIYDKASNWLAGLEKGFILFKRPVPAGQPPSGPWAEVWTSEQLVAAYEAAT